MDSQTSSMRGDLDLLTLAHGQQEISNISLTDDYYVDSHLRPPEWARSVLMAPTIGQLVTIVF